VKSTDDAQIFQLIDAMKSKLKIKDD